MTKKTFWDKIKVCHFTFYILPMVNNAQNKVSNPYDGKGKEELRLIAAQEMQKGTPESLKKA
ncbi:MAG: hypothetical protein WCJ39_05305 [bacterium]